MKKSVEIRVIRGCFVHEKTLIHTKKKYAKIRVIRGDVIHEKALI